MAVLAVYMELVRLHKPAQPTIGRLPLALLSRLVGLVAYPWDPLGYP